ncbi:carboxypeptidase-like regulatory domain-containing protein, partial [Nostoc sp. CHAB 5834]|nr:carboxypeptidase-like regulatory domain-containing protein [Nostoc sp. CHAB 5834]
MQYVYTYAQKLFLISLGVILLMIPALGQSIQTISGKVTDETGQPLPGVTVLLKGSINGTTTSAEGTYRLSLPVANAILVASYVGYKTQEAVVGGQSVIDFKLAPDSKILSEVVVVGYGTQQRKDLTGSIASANLVAFKESPNVSILQSLKGSLPGLTISQTNRAGDEPAINIRGTSTLNGNTAPLIIVDGLIFNGRLSDINPADVASVDVLKDPSSKAVYGSQAANGVVLVTTKTGRAATK